MTESLCICPYIVYICRIDVGSLLGGHCLLLCCAVCIHHAGDVSQTLRILASQQLPSSDIIVYLNHFIFTKSLRRFYGALQQIIWETGWCLDVSLDEDMLTEDYSNCKETQSRLYESTIHRSVQYANRLTLHVDVDLKFRLHAWSSLIMEAARRLALIDRKLHHNQVIINLQH